MKIKSIKITIYVLGALVALYVTGLRITAFLMEYGIQTPETDTTKHLLYFTIPDLISVIFCFGFVLIFIRRIRNIAKQSQ